MPLSQFSRTELVIGAEAVEKGLIDGIGTLSDALDYLHSEIEKRKN